MPEHRSSSGFDQLPTAVSSEMWARLLLRLDAGEVLITNDRFQDALESEFSSVTGKDPNESDKRYIRQMVDAINERFPQTYMAQGVQNCVRNAFEKCIQQLKWDTARIQETGVKSLRRFSRTDGMRDLLDNIKVNLDPNNTTDVVKGAVASSENRREALAAQQQPAKPAFELPDLEASLVEPEPEPEPESDPAQVMLENSTEAKELIAEGEIDREEAGRRLQQQERVRSEIEQNEKEKLPQNLEAYVQQGTLTMDEAEKVKALHEVEERLKRGEIDEAEADHVRNSILERKLRDELDKKVKEAIDSAVAYMEVFDSMKKINADYDQALEFLIRNKHRVTASFDAQVDLSPAIEELMGPAPDGGDSLLTKVCDISARTDPEIRMLSVRFPPYSHVMKRGLEKIGNMIIEQEFIDDLRDLSLDGMSERLNSTDPQTRIRPAADIRCFVSLVDHVVKRTRFRKELRMMRIAQTIEEFFHAATDVAEARKQAESFIDRRMRRMFPDLSTDEGSEINRRKESIIASIEKRVLAEREGPKEEEEGAAGEEGEKKSVGGGGGVEDDMELTDDEKNLGVQIGRVEVRIAGNKRRIPYKIMPDPEDGSRHIIVKRDRDTGELTAEMRRGAKRVVERGKDGIWKAI
jgi:hypothetical protein